MKRHASKHGVKPIKTWFSWLKCHYCEMEFRREYGFKWTHTHNSAYYCFAEQRYGCQSCCGNNVESCDHRIDIEYKAIRESRPKAPPAPPPMRRGDGRYEPLPMPPVKPPKGR